MLTEKETEFIKYWEINRENENRFFRKLINGLPMAILFSFPIVLSVVVIMLFFPDWYAKISGVSNGTVVTIFLSMLLLTLFYSFFRMQYKWEMNEQLYQELIAKQRSKH